MTRRVPEIGELADLLILKDTPLPLIRDPKHVPVFVQLLEGHLVEQKNAHRLLLPNLHHESIGTVAVFSDYGGEAADSAYFTYSVLCVGWNALHYTVQAQQEARRRHGLS